MFQMAGIPPARSHRRGGGPKSRGNPMDIDFIFKIAAIGIIVSVLHQLLTRTGRDEQATMTTIAGLVVVLYMVVQQISRLFDTVKSIFRL